MQIAPGNPSKPTSILVKKFNPIWKPKFAPIRFITKISNPPKIEFKTNFTTFEIGTINTLPKINKKQIHAMYVIIFVSIFSLPIYYLFVNYINFKIRVRDQKDFIN